MEASDIPDIAAISERASLAIGGPWEASTGSTYDKGKRVVTEAFVRLPGDSVALAGEVIDPVTGNPHEPTARFIASARVDVPTLCAYARELEREKASILAAVREFFATEHDLAAECMAMGGHAATDTILRAQTARKALLAMVTP